MRGRKPKVEAMDGGNVTGIKHHAKQRPTELMGKPVAIKAWKRISVVLQEKGLWSRTDPILVTTLCDAWQEAVDCDDLIKEHGLLVPGDRGGVKSNPAVRMKKAAVETVNKALSELGLTPTGSMRTGGIEDPDDAFEELLTRKRNGNSAHS